jgi:ABC-type transport system involved in cytochrome c biogenesis permease subunit
MLHVRLTSGWHGRRFAWLTVGAFGLVVAAAVVLDVFQLGRHSGDYDARPPVASESS